MYHSLVYRVFVRTDGKVADMPFRKREANMQTSVKIYFLGSNIHMLETKQVISKKEDMLI